jgi:hypothetical protein
MKTSKNPMPVSLEAWLEEIAAAYRYAVETIPFGPLVGQQITPSQLFHMSPVLCLKRRGLGLSKKLLKKATEGALSSYVANEERQAVLLSDPRISFAFVYMAAHFALDLLEGQEVGAIMDYVEAHRARLVEMTGR